MAGRLGILVTMALAAALATSPAAAAGSAPARARVAPAAKRAAKAPAGARPDSSARSSGRTLEPIHIEGELDVPEVLFITARDQRRIVDFQHRRYVRTPREARPDLAEPPRVVVSRAGTPAAGGSK